MNRNISKHILTFAMSIVLGISLAGCNKSSEKETVSMYDLQKTMLAADESFPDMTFVSNSDENAEDLFGYLSDMSYDKVDAYFLAYSSAGLADEVAVIACKDTKDVSEAVESLNTHVKDRVNVYTQYSPDQVERAESAVVCSSGKYAVLIISDHKSEVKQSFEDFIK